MAGKFEPQDHYFKLAKERGFVARSAFKLLEIQEKFRLIPAGDECWTWDVRREPGFKQRASAGPAKFGGVVLGVDIQPVQVPGIICDTRVKTIQADAFTLTAEQVKARIGEGLLDVILSDMMSATSGQHFADHVKSVELARRTDLVRGTGQAGRKLRGEGFEGAHYGAFLKECGVSFGEGERIQAAVLTEHLHGDVRGWIGFSPVA